MKEKYIRQVNRELHLPRRKRREVLRDLSEIFDSAREHGETEQQVIARLGAPGDFAQQFGAEQSSARRRRAILSGAAALCVAVACFVLCAVAGRPKAPEGVIGQADAMTGIWVTSGRGVDFMPVLLALGLLAAVCAGIQFVRALRGSGKKR